MSANDRPSSEARAHLHRLSERWAKRHDAVVEVETVADDWSVYVHIRFVNLGHVGFSFAMANGVEHLDMDRFIERCLDEALRDGDLRGDLEFWIPGLRESFDRLGDGSG